MAAGSVLILLVLSATGAFAQWRRTPLQPPASPNPKLYDTTANAQQEIRRAQLAAAREHKRILLVFGGNWCIDCHVLDNAFHQPRIVPLLKDNFIVLHVDVGEYTKNLALAQKYHIDLKKGVPSIAVLETTGAFLYSTSEFEKARVLSEQDVVDFLSKWKPHHAA
jgi:thiol:disulfide interchange protein